MSVISRRWIGVLAGAVALAFFGCGGAPSEAPVAKRTTHTVTIEAMQFQPAELSVAAGDSVVWINRDMFPHTATSKPGGFDSGTIDPDKSWTFTAQASGELAYVCIFHPTMKGTLRVK
jgi:plastocyanin